MKTAQLHFLLDGRDIRLDRVSPTTTLLNWLREDEGRTGTKEGCAEGDCGACTVVVAEARNGELVWRSVNACIQFLPTLHGKALFTVESLRASEGGLHPAQTAMVSCHGSQCGFCTPGFVMSLFGLYQTEAAPDGDAVADALSGNLCRCTGYRPIIDAAQAMYRLPAPGGKLPAPQWQNASDPAAQALLDRLVHMNADDVTLDLVHADSRFTAPRSLDEFASCVARHPDATILAGSTDIGLWITKQFRRLPHLIYLGRVRELTSLSETGGWLDIGAAVTLEDAFEAILPHYPELTELWRRFASRPIRNAGTLCGNIANGSPIGDSMPALIAIGAEVVLRHGDRTRALPLEALYLGYQKKDLAPGEFVQCVRIPLARGPLDEHLIRAWKISRRHDQDISAVFAGFSLTHHHGVVSSARLAFGGMAATPKRASHAEATLIGRPFDDAALSDARAALALDFQPLSDMRASAEYRMTVAQNLLARLHHELAGHPTRIDNVEADHGQH
ncbi:MAG: xanthine dehydrogenase small subunit [Azoarcus sp.]|nr:xanthine dehydrogenase small subunit [Azoarcus sp.]